MEECENVDEMAKKLGFEDESELWKMVGNVDLSTSDLVAAFEKWKIEDGTKSGLLKLPALP